MATSSIGGVFNIKEVVNSRNFRRIDVVFDGLVLQVDFVVDRVRRLGQSTMKDGIVLDNELNILTNKMGAILDRDAARDVVDLVVLAMNRSWSWPYILQQTQLKTRFNCEDFVYRLKTFPIAEMDAISFVDTWNQPDWKWAINTIIHDLETAALNSLGKGKIKIG